MAAGNGQGHSGSFGFSLQAWGSSWFGGLFGSSHVGVMGEKKFEFGVNTYDVG